MALGAKLQEAREKRKLSPSEVAAGTRMKVQIVEDLEREDFSRIAAPVYGKGFIKLYAEFVGLKPRPLIDEYVARFVNPPPPGSLANDITFQETEPEAEDEEVELSDESPFGLGDETTHGEPDLFSHATRKGDAPAPAQKRGLAELFGKFRKAITPSSPDYVSGTEADTTPERTDEELEVGEDYAKFADEGPGPRAHYSLPRVVLASVGVLFIVLFLASCLRKCGQTPPSGPDVATPSPAKLEVALEPEEPYID